MQNFPTLLLMLKAPRAGLVKTRLARGIGDREALRIYRLLVESQLGRLPVDWPVEIHFTPSDATWEMKQWLGEAYTYFSQADGDFGNRLIQVLTGTFARGAKSAILLGGDCPELTTKTLEEAYEQLETSDIVIGPATDGGYYLLGVKNVHHFIFEEISWSTEHVYRQTVESARTHGLKISTLEMLSDIDDLDSWLKFGTYSTKRTL